MKRSEEEKKFIIENKKKLETKNTAVIRKSKMLKVMSLIRYNYHARSTLKSECEGVNSLEKL